MWFVAKIIHATPIEVNISNEAIDNGAPLTIYNAQIRLNQGGDWLDLGDIRSGNNSFTINSTNPIGIPGLIRGSLPDQRNIISYFKKSGSSDNVNIKIENIPSSQLVALNKDKLREENNYEFKAVTNQGSTLFSTYLGDLKSVDAWPTDCSTFKSPQSVTDSEVLCTINVPKQPKVFFISTTDLVGGFDIQQGFFYTTLKLADFINKTNIHGTGIGNTFRTRIVFYDDQMNSIGNFMGDGFSVGAFDITAGRVLSSGRYYGFVTRDTESDSPIVKILDKDHNVVGNTPLMQYFPGITELEAFNTVAVMYYLNSGVPYYYIFLKNGNYMRYNIIDDQFDEGERPIDQNWEHPGDWPSGISATNLQTVWQHPNGETWFIASDKASYTDPSWMHPDHATHQSFKAYRVGSGEVSSLFGQFAWFLPSIEFKFNLMTQILGIITDVSDNHKVYLFDKPIFI